MQKRFNYIIGGLLVSLGIIIGVFGFMIGDKFLSITTESTQSTTSDETYSEISELIEIIEERAYYFEDRSALIDGALRGIVDSLGDPYSEYLSEKEFSELLNQLNAEIYGLGISIVVNGKYPIIVEVMDNSPAALSGLQPGDTIKTIDGVDIKNKPLEEVGSMIRGGEGEVRQIGVYKDNPNKLNYYNIRLDEIHKSTVSYSYEKIGSEILGYLRIESFGTYTFGELNEAMTELEDIGIDYLIIDVRNNPGGYLDTVQSILDYFINTDVPFMYSQTKSGAETRYYLTNIDHVINYDIVVLINDMSASAAEIFASAMNEIGQYELIGTKTFGKGTIQVTYNMDMSNWVKITTAIWLTPSKVWIGKEGISPTILVEAVSSDMFFIDAHNDIKFDVVNENVKYTQLLLKALGYDVRTDGYFDKNTEEAVKQYQLEIGVENTGIVDFKTAYHLNRYFINLLTDLEYDNQYQEAKNYFIN